MTYTFLLLVATALPVPPAHVAPPPPPGPHYPLCQPRKDDAGSLRGTWRVLGRHADEAYTGEVSIAGDERAASVTITGRVDGRAVLGHARKVECGPDRVPHIEVTLGSGSAARQLYCTPHTDYDNFHRMSCSQRLSDPNGDIELWTERYAH